MTIEIIDVRRLIPDMGSNYNADNNWQIENTHFSDIDVQSFINDAKKSNRDEVITKYYAAKDAVVTWYKELKLTDANIKQNSLSVGRVGATDEKLLDLLAASQADLESKIREEEGVYFDISYAPDGFWDNTERSWT
ncbi:MAG: hypothetical protein LBT91_02710 [Bifidobacteriaceae bacterium]|jgi:hypothetical protein|nr:hypothetical protein [Bifidobacteriaceae bacterium]